MDVHTDYYAVLELDPLATPREVRQAYRRLVRRVHPDAGNAPGTSEAFQRVQEAYEVLSDPDARAAYDRLREQEGLVHPPALQLRHTTSYSALPRLDEEQMLYALVEITSRGDAGLDRLPFNLCLVIDRSTSMQGVRLHRVKEAVQAVIDDLEPADTFSLVTFSDRAKVVLPAQAHLDKAAARAEVNAIRTSGGTEILQGLKAGLSEIDRRRSPEVANHLILLTDGQTYGDEQGCIEAARKAAQRQISITTMGIGHDWNDVLLDEIAHQSGGTSEFIDSASSVSFSFRSCLQHLSTILARDLQLRLGIADGVRLIKAHRVTPTMAVLLAAGDTLRLGALSAEQPVSVMLSLAVSAPQTGPLPVAQLDLTANVPTYAEREQRARGEIEVDVVDGLELDGLPPAHMVSILGKLAILEVEEKTMQDLDADEHRRAGHRLETMATRLVHIGETELARAALLEAGQIARTGRISPEGRKRIRYGTRALSEPNETPQ
jgi:Ca-activated chloride channel family protein